MALTLNDLSSSVVAALALSEPALDTSIGSVTRKIIDAASGMAVEAYSDSLLTTYAYDIDSKTAGDLDDFVALFGLARQQAQRASGVLTFSRPTSVAALQTAVVPPGTQVVAQVSPNVVVQTMTSALLAVGQISVDVPAQAVVAGPNGNVGSGLFVSFATSVTGVTSVTNTQAFTNGAGGETDDQLRSRFKSTVFRNLAGTTSMYRAMALQTAADPTDPSSRAVTQVNVIGPKSTWYEQVQVTGGVATFTTCTDAAYIYPNSIYLGADLSNGTLSGNFLTPVSQYTTTLVNTVYPATLSVTTVTGAGVPNGLYDLQFDYVPTYSRNDPMGTRWGGLNAYVTNRVDVWVNGVVPATAVQTCIFNTGSILQFNATAHDPLLNTRFKKLDGTNPAVGDIFMPLGFGPIISVPATIGTAILNTDYFVVHQSDAFGYSPTSKFGLAWKNAGNHPANLAPLTVSYIYNSTPASVQATIEGNWRLLGTDVWVHAGLIVNVQLNLAIIFSRNTDVASATTNINTALATMINSLGFNSSLQVSDILQTVHNVGGVDNVRFIASIEGGVGQTNYAIQPVTYNGTTRTVGTPFALSDGAVSRAVDINFDDASYPVYDSVNITVKAKNNFGTG